MAKYPCLWANWNFRRVSSPKREIQGFAETVIFRFSDDQIGRLAKDVKDQKVFYTRFHPDGKCPALPLSFSKFFTYKADDDSLAVKIPIKYGIYEIEAVLKVNQTKSENLECYLFRDTTVMTDRIPEFTISIIDIENVSVIKSLSIVKHDSYVSAAIYAIRGRKKSTGRGWSNFVERSKLIEGKLGFICHIKWICASSFVLNSE